MHSEVDTCTCSFWVWFLVAGVTSNAGVIWLCTILTKPYAYTLYVLKGKTKNVQAYTTACYIKGINSLDHISIFIYNSCMVDENLRATSNLTSLHITSLSHQCRCTLPVRTARIRTGRSTYGSRISVPCRLKSTWVLRPVHKSTRHIVKVIEG